MIKRAVHALLSPAYRRLKPYIYHKVNLDLIQHTEDYSHLTWLGRPIWQPPTDLWTIQETIAEIRPSILIETGSHRGGSALFYAHLFDLMNHGRVVTIDVQKLHDITHPRIRFLLGSSVDETIIAEIERETNAAPVMIILDSHHSADHVAREMEAYHRLVTPGSYLLVQDGVIDVSGKSGPLKAIRDFLPLHPEFEVDHEKCNRFLITYHPMGWLKRR
jgi:cephalosporin hydroxylase